MSEYKFRRADETCYADIETLHRAAFKENPIPDYYKNKMDTSYLGVKHLCFIAYTDTGEVAAFYAVYPCMMEYKGKQYLAAQSGDTMTHPSHTGKGLFTALAKMTYELAKENTIQFIFGFPNDNSYPGFVKKLSWIHKENMNDYWWSVSALPLSGAAKKFSFLMPLYRLYTKIVLGFYSTKNTYQPNSVINDTYGGVYRDAKSFQYKSFYNNYLVDIKGRSAWIKIDGALLLGDIEPVPTEKIDELVSGLKSLAFWLGCPKILFSVGKDTTWDKLLKQKLVSQEHVYVGYLDLQSGLDLDKFKYVLADFDTF